MNPPVSIIVPCRNEIKHIDAFLQSIKQQDYLQDNLEIIIADGLSGDGTIEKLIQFNNQHDYVKIIENEQQSVPYALNKAINIAKGEIIIRMDVHAIYPNNYISKLVFWKEKLDADNVGGVCETLSANDTLTAQAIAAALAHPFGVGNAYFRIGAKQPIETDTVPFGCYHKTVFEKIGLFDSELNKNQDDEFNGRLKKNGGKIWLVPDIKIKYFSRENLKQLWKMYYRYGYYKPLVNKKLGAPATMRQLVPLVFVLSLLAFVILSIFNEQYVWFLIFISGLYLLVNMFMSIIIAFKNKLAMILVLPIVFSCIHLSYGFGYLVGIVNFMVLYTSKSK